MRNVTIALLLVFLIPVLGIFLQIFLSKRESKWPGLILPILSFLFSAVYPLNMAASNADSLVATILVLLLIWLFANIPTFILLAIYYACRGKYRRQKQLDKMNIQDLD